MRLFDRLAFWRSEDPTESEAFKEYREMLRNGYVLSIQHPKRAGQTDFWYVADFDGKLFLSDQSGEFYSHIDDAKLAELTVESHGSVHTYPWQFPTDPWWIELHNDVGCELCRSESVQGGDSA